MKLTLTLLLLAAGLCQAAEYTFSTTEGSHSWWDADAWQLDGAPATWENGAGGDEPEHTVRIQSDAEQTITITQDVSVQGIDILGSTGGQGTIIQGTGSETIHLGTGSVNLHATSGNRFLKFKDITLDMIDGATSTWNFSPVSGNWLVFDGTSRVTGTGTWALNFGALGYSLTLSDTNGNNQVNASAFTGTIQLQRGTLKLNQAYNGNIDVASGATSTALYVNASGSFSHALTLGTNSVMGMQIDEGGSFTGMIHKENGAKLLLQGTINESTLALAQRENFQTWSSNVLLGVGAEKSISRIESTSNTAGYIVLTAQGENLAQYIDVVINNNNNNQGDLILADNFADKEAHIGNLSGSASNSQVRVDWGSVNGTRTLVVHQTENATFAGAFTQSIGTYDRRSALTKMGAATLTLSGASTTTELLRVAEGAVNLTGSWLGTGQVDDDASLVVSGTLGSNAVENTYTVAERGSASVQGTGTIANSGISISAQAAARSAEPASASLKNVTVAANGITRTSGTGNGEIRNAHLNITRADNYNISRVALIDTLVDLQSGGSLTLDNVTLGGSTSLANAAGHAVTLSGASSLKLESGIAQSGSSLTYTPAGGAELTFAGLTTSQLSGATLASGATLTLDVSNGLLCSAGLAGQQYLAITLEGFTGADGSALTIDNFLLDSHLTDGFQNPEASPSILGVETAAGGGTVVYISFSPAMMPEPSTAALSLLGLTGLLMRRRRKPTIARAGR